MRVAQGFTARLAGVMLGLWLAVLACNCSDFSRKTTDFEANMPPARLIYNPDSNVVPLPNDLLNPVAKYALDLEVPGIDAPTSSPQEMDLWIIDADKVLESEERGYDIEEDSLLTQDLKKGMNARNGYIPEFFTPEIPFSSPLEAESLVPYLANEADNLDNANFFFLDITDPNEPVPIAPEEYHLLFNLPGKTEPPYMMTFRNRSPMITMMPERFLAGHTYFVALAGDEVSGPRDTQGYTFERDSVFTLLSSETSFLSSDGARRINLFKDIERIRELEEARLVTAHGLNAWKNLVGDRRERSEIITAFQFTIATNPQAWYFDPTLVVLGRNALRPDGAVGFALKDGEAVEICSDAGTDFEPTFTISAPVDSLSATEKSVRLYRESTNGKLTPVEAAVNVETLETGESLIRLTPQETLEESATYVVAANDGLTGENEAGVVGEVYFDLARAGFPLVEGDTWLSPFLDVRADVLITLGLLEGDGPIAQASQENLETATNTFLNILRVLEAIRLSQQDRIQALLEAEFIETKEDLVMLYRFRTSGC